MKRQIAVLQRNLVQSDSTARVTAAEQLHMTIAFIPDLSSRKEKDLLAGFGVLQLPSPLITCTALSTMHTGNGRVYYLAVRPEVQLDQITTRIRKVLDDCHITYDRRGVKYHITVARGRGVTESHRQDLSLPESFHVQKLTLFYSQLTHTGPIHTPVLSIPLNPLGTPV